MKRAPGPEQVPRTAPCAAGCPNGADVRGWISTIAQRVKTGLGREAAYREAWEILADVNPFPATLGRICPHPCESGCNRADHDGAVAVHDLERFLGDWALARRLPLPPEAADGQPASIGVIGAGPAGLSFAYQMVRRGHRVRVYESYPEPGGMLRYGVPAYRLPRDVLDAEIERILDLGVELQTGVRIGRDLGVDELETRHDVVFVGIGAHRGRSLGIPGEAGPGVWTGTEYLSLRNRNERVDAGSRVAVIGGGDTAIDAARSARRQGADVTVLYRRTRAEMPAIDSEIEEAELEGVRIEYLVAPVSIGRTDGRVRSVCARRMKLGAPDDSGRRRPVPVEGSEFEIEVDGVVAAVSQDPDWDGMDPRRSGPGEHPAGGDVLGLGIASRAVAQGRFAAESVRYRLAGIETPERGDPERAATTPISTPHVKLEYYERRPRVAPRHRPPEEWLLFPEEEIHAGITAEEFESEAGRCLSCGQCFGCRACWNYCAHGCFDALLRPRTGEYYAVVENRCEACGKCADLCPCGFLLLRDGRDPAERREGGTP